MIYFVSMTRKGSQTFVRYEGMGQATIQSLLADLGAFDVTFVDEATYLAAQPKI